MKTLKINFKTFQIYIFQDHKTIYKVDFVFRKLLVLLSTKTIFLVFIGIWDDIRESITVVGLHKKTPITRGLYWLY